MTITRSALLTAVPTIDSGIPVFALMVMLPLTGFTVSALCQNLMACSVRATIAL